MHVVFLSNSASFEYHINRNATTGTNFQLYKINLFKSKSTVEKLTANVKSSKFKTNAAARGDGKSLLRKAGMTLNRSDRNRNITIDQLSNRYSSGSNKAVHPQNSPHDITNKIDTFRSQSNFSDDVIDIQIVYFAFINPGAKWKWLIGEQLKDLKKCGILSESKLFIALSTPLDKKSGHHGTQRYEAVRLLDNATSHIKSILGKTISSTVSFNITLGNYYEYPGISLVWYLSRLLNPLAAHSTVFLYFHSKGMSDKYGFKKNRHDKIYMEKVIFSWKTVLKKFLIDPLLNKAGYAASPKGNK